MRVPATKVDKNFQFTPFQRIRISFRNHFSPFEASKFLSISHFHKNFQPSPNVIAIYPDRQIHLKNIAYEKMDLISTDGNNVAAFRICSKFQRRHWYRI